MPTASGPLYDVDTRLRPQGAQGMLAVGLDAFEPISARKPGRGSIWRLCRARPLDRHRPRRGPRTARLVCSILKIDRDPARSRADAAAMRAEMATHKPPLGEFDVKLGPGGLVDLEFAVHMLQLTRHIGLDPRLEVALEALVDAGLIDGEADRGAAGC